MTGDTGWRFNTQPPEGGWSPKSLNTSGDAVSTHSRPKAAGNRTDRDSGQRDGFNTQPPEGGWSCSYCITVWIALFQHTAARRRLVFPIFTNTPLILFQHTAARRRLVFGFGVSSPAPVGFNTQPPEGGWKSLILSTSTTMVSTHSRPKAAGLARIASRYERQSFNTQPPEGGWAQPKKRIKSWLMFQHTAARRRLVRIKWLKLLEYLFQHTAARRRLDINSFFLVRIERFQHTAARRRLAELYGRRE